VSTETHRPTRREERRAQTVQEIKSLAMEQIRQGGPDAVSLSGIVREMSMSPAAVYRYFENRDALLADLVVDAYDDFADSLAAVAPAGEDAAARLTSVLDGIRSWALDHPNPYRLIFQTSIGSGQDLAPERTVSAASRSMAVLVAALAEASTAESPASGASVSLAAAAESQTLHEAIRAWGERSGLSDIPSPILHLALISWTRLHGVISLELGGHLASAGIDPGALYAAEVSTIRAAATVSGGGVDAG
jgi:AcrR family transcriptional regulator